MFSSKYNFFYVSFFIIFLSLLLAANLSNIKAAGISPPVVEIKNILKGTKQTENVTIFRNPNSTENLVITAEAQGEYKKYIEFTSNKIKIPSSKKSVNFSFIVNAEDASIGKYKVPISFFYGVETGNSDSSSGGNAVAIVQGVQMTVNFNVSGDQILKYKISNFGVSDSEININLPISYVVDNTGNVDWKPSKVKIEVTDQKDNSNVYDFEIDGSRVPINTPGKKNKSTFSLEHELPFGIYRAKAYFYYDGEVVEELTSNKFDIFLPGTLKQIGELLSVKLNKEVYQAGDKIKLSAIFKNTGEVKVDGQLIIEISQGDDVIDLIKGESLSVNKKQQVEFSEIFGPLDVGTYDINVYIKYGNKKSNKKKVVVNVNGLQFNKEKKEGTSKSGLSNNMVSAVAVTATSATILIGAFAWRRRKMKDEYSYDDYDDYDEE